jgi:hypothetical protein
LGGEILPGGEEVAGGQVYCSYGVKFKMYGNRTG